MRIVVAAALVGTAFIACGGGYSSDDPENQPTGDGGGPINDPKNPRPEGGTLPESGLPPEPGKPLTVTGKIVTYGVALANISVVVGGKTAVNTSTLGTFTVADVTPPYDVVFAIKTNDAQPRITVYRGLTRPDPTLVAIGTAGELRPNATTATSINGKVTGGGGPPWTPRTPPLVVFAGPSRAAGLGTLDATAGTYEMKETNAPTWYGTSSVTGALHAVVITGAAGSETSFHARIPDIRMTSGATLTRDITVEPVPTVQLTTKVTGPAIYNTAAAVVNSGVRLEETGGYFLKGQATTLPATVTRAVPVVAGSQLVTNVGYSTTSDAESSFARGTKANAAGATTIDLALAEPPRPAAPAADATVPRTSDFTYSPFEGGIYRVTFSAANQPSIVIVTAGTSVTLPDLTPFAVTIPPNTQYTWRVTGYRPLTSLDDDGLAVLIANQDGGLPSVDRCEIALSATRKVTLGP